MFSLDAWTSSFCRLVYRWPGLPCGKPGREWEEKPVIRFCADFLNPVRYCSSPLVSKTLFREPPDPPQWRRGPDLRVWGERKLKNLGYGSTGRYPHAQSSQHFASEIYMKRRKIWFNPVSMFWQLNLPWALKQYKAYLLVNSVSSLCSGLFGPLNH